MENEIIESVKSSHESLKREQERWTKEFDYLKSILTISLDLLNKINSKSHLSDKEQTLDAVDILLNETLVRSKKSLFDLKASASKFSHSYENYLSHSKNDEANNS